MDLLWSHHGFIMSHHGFIMDPGVGVSTVLSFCLSVGQSLTERSLRVSFVDF